MPPSSFGGEYLTYVLWAISPDGRPVNMGELTLNRYGQGSRSEIKTASEIQTFGMIVTAEPYYAVTQPSDVVVMENVVRKDTKGVIETVDAKYELMPRGIYTSEGKAGGFVPIHVNKKNPFELYEAENAVMLARLAGAEQYASDSYKKAVEALAWANRNQAQKPGQKPVITMAREAVVRAEDARVIAIRAQREEALARERAESLARETASAAKAEQEARERAGREGTVRRRRATLTCGGRAGIGGTRQCRSPSNRGSGSRRCHAGARGSVGRDRTRRQRPASSGDGEIRSRPRAAGGP